MTTTVVKRVPLTPGSFCFGISDQAHVFWPSSARSGRPPPVHRDLASDTWTKTWTPHPRSRSTSCFRPFSMQAANISYYLLLATTMHASGKTCVFSCESEAQTSPGICPKSCYELRNQRFLPLARILCLKLLLLTVGYHMLSLNARSHIQIIRIVVLSGLAAPRLRNTPLHARFCTLEKGSKNPKVHSRQRHQVSTHSPGFKY